MKYLIAVIIVFTIPLKCAFGEAYSLHSPGRCIEVTLHVDSAIRMEVMYRSDALLKVDHISLDLAGKSFASGIRRIKSIKTDSVERTIVPVIREKYGTINEKFNMLNITFRGGYGFDIRVFDEGVAYRFLTSFRDSIVVRSENLEVIPEEGDSIYFQRSETFHSSYETPYEHHAINEVTTDGFICLPVLIRKHSGINVLITESDLDDYPGLWLKGTGNSSFVSAHAGYPVAYRDEGSPYGQGQVKEHAGFIAKTGGSRSFPWRIFAISPTDAGLITNTLVYQLAKPTRMDDVSWIKPGVVTFDWWGKRNIYGTGFKSGINTATAKYFIDFAAEFGFEYFLFDDGWSEQDDLFAIHPDLDMEEVMAYAGEKDVQVMLWVIWNTFEKQWDEAWEKFEKWGIGGIKFDFMNRDDQKMVRFYHRVAREAAKRKMVIDFHGAYKPAGLRRMYPNVLTREALIEFEYNGWTAHDTPDHHNLLPYIRMAAGPMDYIPFTTRNAQKKNFRPVGDRPMGMGTRAHSMALFVILESPMQMLPDSPSDYYRERECTEFVSDLPVEWDDLKVLRAQVGEVTAVARKSGDEWFVGAITDWDPREFEISFDFLSDGQYHMEYFEDGINADTRAIDYLRKTRTITADDTQTVILAPGGGWIARISRLSTQASCRDGDADTEESAPFFHTEHIFPFQDEHVHGSTIVELPNGDLLTGWFQGSGERQADDVRVMGARRKCGGTRWSEPFLLADVKGFPDCNPILFLDGKKRLWLMWYSVIAHQWETSLLKYRISEDYQDMPGAPKWKWQADLHIKPGDNAEQGIQPDDSFVASVEKQLEAYIDYIKSSAPREMDSVMLKRHVEEILSKARGEDMVRRGRIYREDAPGETTALGYPYFRRMGWQTRNKPFITSAGRMIVPLYSDGFSFSLMAFSDDFGETWDFSDPLVGGGNIQPSIARTGNGELVAYMRDNGPVPKRLHISRSSDNGETWSPVRDSEIPNPGSAADVVTLENGNWVLVCNNTEKGRHRLTVALSEDEGLSWPWQRSIVSAEPPTSAHYPAIIRGADGLMHVSYSYFTWLQEDQLKRTIQYAVFNESWIKNESKLQEDHGQY